MIGMNKLYKAINIILKEVNLTQEVIKQIRYLRDTHTLTIDSLLDLFPQIDVDFDSPEWPEQFERYNSIHAKRIEILDIIIRQTDIT